MKNYRDEYKSRVRLLVKSPGITADALAKKYGQPSGLAITRWLSNDTWPPLDSLIKIAEENRTNIDYILGKTDVCSPNETYELNFRLGELMKERGLTRTKLATMIGTSTKVITKYLTAPIMTRINTIIALAEALDVSVDYLCGLTPYRVWELQIIETDTFFLIKKGQAACILCEDGHYEWCLLSEDGMNVILPDGKYYSLDDNRFEGKKAFPVCPILPEEYQQRGETGEKKEKKK